jgi:hypothetical protein
MDPVVALQRLRPVRSWRPYVCIGAALGASFGPHDRPVFRQAKSLCVYRLSDLPGIMLARR